MKWEDPPVSAHADSTPKAWAEEAAELRSRPGCWAVLAEFSSEVRTKAYDLSVNVKQGRIVAFRPSGHFEAVVRKDKDNGKHVVYARYVRGNSEAARS